MESVKINPEPIQAGQTRHMNFRADMGEFKKWFEENIGEFKL